MAKRAGGSAGGPAAPYRVSRPLPPLPANVLRAPARVWAPWEAGEDCVLAAVAAQAATAAAGSSEGAPEPDAATWQLASDAIAAGAAELSSAAAASAAQQARSTCPGGHRILFHGGRGMGISMPAWQCSWPACRMAAVRNLPEVPRLLAAHVLPARH